MSADEHLVFNTSIVAIGERAMAIEGPPGSGKSSLALALMDRGAGLIGDDGARVIRSGSQLIAHPPEATRGLIEVRGVGLVEVGVADPAPLALFLTLCDTSERLPDGPLERAILGCTIPVLEFVPGTIAPASRAMWALQTFGLEG